MIWTILGNIWTSNVLAAIMYILCDEFFMSVLALKSFSFADYWSPGLSPASISSWHWKTSTTFLTLLLVVRLTDRWFYLMIIKSKLWAVFCTGKRGMLKKPHMRLRVFSVPWSYKWRLIDTVNEHPCAKQTRWMNAWSRFAIYLHYCALRLYCTSQTIRKWTTVKLNNSRRSWKTVVKATVNRGLCTKRWRWGKAHCAPEQPPISLQGNV